MPELPDSACLPTQTGTAPAATEEITMRLRRYWPTALLLLAVSLSACSSNHKFNDGDYRPLGDPPSVNRGE